MLRSRRHFLQVGLTSGAAALAVAQAQAIDPIVRTGRQRLRLSLAAYSYRRYLNLQNPTMTLAEFIDTAAAMQLDAVELTGYYFAQTTPAYLAQLKARCTRLGLDISGTATRNDFCTPNNEQRTRDINHVKRWIEHTALLGGKTLRIFAGSVAQGDTEERARERCVAAIQEVCDHARNYGVYVALENHGGITGTSAQMLALVRAVRHELFGVNLDTGNFHSADPYADLARLAPYAVVVQLKTEIQRAGQQRPEAADLRRLIEILQAAGYRGYVALEHEANEDPRETVPGHIQRLRQLVG